MLMNTYTEEIEHPVTIPSKNVFLNGFYLFLKKLKEWLSLFMEAEAAASAAVINMWPVH